VQELFYRLWKGREKISVKISLEGYLYRSVHNMCLHHLDHRKVVDRHNKEMETAGNDAFTNPEEEMHHKELLDMVARILEKLPERCGMIFYMNRFEGLKYSEIARKLKISVKTVEANMGKALKEFRKSLAEQR
jgi:RNA polymerase sigma-70 factor (ECF subfamily)